MAVRLFPFSPVAHPPASAGPYNCAAAAFELGAFKFNDVIKHEGVLLPFPLLVLLAWLLRMEFPVTAVNGMPGAQDKAALIKDHGVKVTAIWLGKVRTRDAVSKRLPNDDKRMRFYHFHQCSGAWDACGIFCWSKSELCCSGGLQLLRKAPCGAVSHLGSSSESFFHAMGCRVYLARNFSRRRRHFLSCMQSAWIITLCPSYSCRCCSLIWRGT